MSGVLKNIKECIMSKWIGCFVALPALVLTFVQIISYSFVSTELFHSGVIIASVFGIVAFVALSLFRKTSQLAPVALMACNLAAIVSFASADGIVDVFSTLFFDGFSIGKIFSLPAAEWLSILLFVITFILSSVAVYLPQNRKPVTDKENEE